MAELVITEKPSVARSIANVLGAREKHEGYIELEQTEHSLFGGSTYQVKYEPFIKRFKRDTLWICPVTLFVLGRYPKFIYIKSL